MFRSQPSKVLSFLSLHIHHSTQCGIAFQRTQFLCLPNLPCQHAKTSTILLGITQCIPNKLKTIVQSSLAKAQWRNKWSTDSPSTLHIQHPHLLCTYNTNSLKTNDKAYKEPSSNCLMIENIRRNIIQKLKLKLIKQMISSCLTKSLKHQPSSCLFNLYFSILRFFISRVQPDTDFVVFIHQNITILTGHRIINNQHVFNYYQITISTRFSSNWNPRADSLLLEINLIPSW